MLAVYGLVFMVILPVAVGSWWYRSIKYSAEQILMDTMQLYRFFVHKTPNMILKSEYYNSHMPPAYVHSLNKKNIYQNINAKLLPECVIISGSITDLIKWRKQR